MLKVNIRGSVALVVQPPRKNIGLFQIKTTPVEDINGNFQGVYQKLMKKGTFPGGVKKNK